MTDQKGRLWISIQVLLGTALAGSTWAFYASQGCGSCGEAAAGTGGSILSALGIAYYAILLGVSLLLGPSKIVFAGITVAAGVHVSLLALLFSRGVFCPPCFLTGAAAISAIILSFFQDSQNLTRATWTLPGTALVWNMVAIYGLGIAAPPIQAQGEALEAAVQYESATSEDSSSLQVRMTVYSNPQCHYCQQLKEEIAPRLEAEFGSSLAIEWRSASNFPGMPTPTIFINRAEFQAMFPGLPSEQVLRDTILDAQGKDTASAMLQTSR